jgi:hypothetical protein
MTKIKECALYNWNFMKIKGNNPSKWPIDLQYFLKSVKDVPYLHFFNEPDHVH